MLVCAYKVDTNHQILFASCSHFPFQDTEGNAQLFAIFAEADDRFDLNISN